MSWKTDTVDGVTVEKRSIVDSGAEWAAVDERLLDYETERSADRFDLPDGFGDSFEDDGDVTMTGGSFKETLGCVEASSTPVGLGDNVVPSMTSNTSGGFIASSSSEYYDGLYPPWKAYNGVTHVTTDGWVSEVLYASNIGNEKIALTRVDGASMTVSGVRLVPFNLTAGAVSGTPRDFVMEGSDVATPNDTTDWTTIQSYTGVTDWSLNESKTYTFAQTETYRHLRIRCTLINGALQYFCLGELEWLGKGPDGKPEEATITVTPWTPSSDLEATRVKLWLEDSGNTGAIACGAESTDLVQAYLSYDGGVTYGSAIEFTDIRETFDGSNVFIFESDEIDLTSETISSLVLKVQSFDLGDGAPSFKFHTYQVAARSVEDE